MNSRDLFPVLFCGLSIPLSMFMWLGNVAFSRLSHTIDGDEPAIIPPTRWLFSTLAPLLFAVVGLKRKSVNKSGAALGIVFALILSISSHMFFACLVTFFFSSSRATKFRANIKKKIEKDFKDGEGQRNWVQVLCNGGMATQLAILYLIDCGSSERPIDFAQHYRSSWLGIAILSALSSCNGDTWASEIGCVLSKSDPFLVTTRKRVPRGTNGGVSMVGLIVSFLGGVVVGISYYLTLIYTVDGKSLQQSPPQWPIIIVGGLAGFLGSLVDSWLGATLQFSGVDEEGKIVESPGPNVRHVSGLKILDNHSVNLISSIITGVTIPLIALKLWPEV